MNQFTCDVVNVDLTNKISLTVDENFIRREKKKTHFRYAPTIKKYNSKAYSMLRATLGHLDKAISKFMLILSFQIIYEANQMMTHSIDLF